MSLFNRGPKKLKGIIVHKPSGYSLTLPDNWTAYSIKDDFIMGSDKDKYSSIMFSVIHHAMVKKGDMINPVTGEKIGDTTRTMDGDFVTYEIEIEKGKWVKFWETETNRYFIRLFYFCAKEDWKYDMATVRQIIHSLNTDVEEE